MTEHNFITRPELARSTLGARIAGPNERTMLEASPAPLPIVREEPTEPVRRARAVVAAPPTMLRSRAIALVVLTSAASALLAGGLVAALLQ